MPNVYLWNGLEYTGNEGGGDTFGSLDVPQIVSVTGQPYKNTAEALAQNGTFKLWDINQGPTDFALAFILSDTGDPSNGYVMLEMITDLNNLIGKQQYTVPLLANVPFILGASASYANYSAGFAGGTLSKIQSFKVKNLNVNAANVTLWLAL